MYIHIYMCVCIYIYIYTYAYIYIYIHIHIPTWSGHPICGCSGPGRGPAWIHNIHNDDCM